MIFTNTKKYDNCRILIVYFIGWYTIFPYPMMALLTKMI